MKRLEMAFWTMLPGLITLGFLIVCLIPKRISGLDNFMPLLVVIPIFHWGMSHAREMPYWFVFIVGLIMDALTSPVLGISALSYVFFLAMLHAQRKYIHKEGFVIKWAYFAVLLLAMIMVQWVFIGLLYTQMAGMAPSLVQWVLTVGTYPILYNVFDRIQSYSAHRRWCILHGV